MDPKAKLVTIQTHYVYSKLGSHLPNPAHQQRKKISSKLTKLPPMNRPRRPPMVPTKVISVIFSLL